MAKKNESDVKGDSSSHATSIDAVRSALGDGDSQSQDEDQDEDDLEDEDDADDSDDDSTGEDDSSDAEGDEDDSDDNSEDDADDSDDGKEGDEDNEGDEGDEELVGGKPLHKHKRFQQLVQQKNEALDAKTKLEKIVSPNVDLLKTLRDNNLSREDSLEAVALFNEIKRATPSQALKKLEQLKELISKESDLKDPEWLTKGLEEGTISEEAAEKVRADRQELADKSAVAEQAQTKVKRDAARDVVEKNMAVSQSWVAEKIKIDPSLATPENVSAITSLIKGEIATVGSPRNPQEAVDICERCYKTLKGVQGKKASKKPVKKVMKSSAGKSSRKTTKPKTSLEAVRAALKAG